MDLLIEYLIIIDHSKFKKLHKLFSIDLIVYLDVFFQIKVKLLYRIPLNNVYKNSLNYLHLSMILLFYILIELTLLDFKIYEKLSVFSIAN